MLPISRNLSTVDRRPTYIIVPRSIIEKIVDEIFTRNCKNQAETHEERLNRYRLEEIQL